MLRESINQPTGRCATGARGEGRAVSGGGGADLGGALRFTTLKAWRAEVARSHNLPA